MRIILLTLFVALGLGGCVTTEKQPEPKIVSRTVNIAIPIECQEDMPKEPEYKTRELPEGTELFLVTRTALAELDTRDGYELELRTALANCKKPVAAKPATPEQK